MALFPENEKNDSIIAEIRAAREDLAELLGLDELPPECQCDDDYACRCREQS